jgi:hypothetical protein
VEVALKPLWPYLSFSSKLALTQVSSHTRRATGGLDLCHIYHIVTCWALGLDLDTPLGLSWKFATMAQYFNSQYNHKVDESLWELLESSELEVMSEQMRNNPRRKKTSFSPILYFALAQIYFIQS